MNICEILANLPDMLCVRRIETPEPYGETVDTFAIRYRSDECEVEGYAAVPKAVDVLLPGLVFNRGGNREFGHLIPEKVCRYAAYGYVTLGSQYRGNCGGTGREEFGGREVNDIIKLVDLTLALPFVRKEGIYMAGHSRGGMMTYITCTRDTRIRAAAVGAGVTDSFLMYYREREPMAEVYQDLVGGSPEELPEEFEKRSAVRWADRILPPMLICQGTNDWRVEPEQSYALDRALEAAGKEHKLIVYPGADHSLAGTSYIPDEIAWFRAHPLG